MAKTVKDAYSEILRLRNEFYQRWQEVPQYDENRDAYKAKYEAFDKALELLTPSLVEERPEPISPAEVGFEALGKVWDEETKKKSGELTHSEMTKISDQEESISEDLKKASEEYTDSLGDNYPALQKAFKAGGQWQKQQIIGKACEWVRTHRDDDFFELVPEYNYCGAGNLNIDKMVEEFRKYLEE